MVSSGFFFLLHRVGCIAQGIHEAAAMIQKILVQTMCFEELLGLLIFAALVKFLQHCRLILEVTRRIDKIEQEEQFGATLVLNKANGIGLICLLNGPGALKTLFKLR